MMKKRWIKGTAALLCAAFLCAAGGATALAENGAAAETETEAAEELTVNTDAAITSCVIAGDKNTIQVTAEGNGDMANTDGYLYLFELKPYESEIGSRTDYAAWANGGTSASFNLSLNRGRRQTASTAGLWWRC